MSAAIEVQGEAWIQRIAAFRVSCWRAWGALAPQAFPDGAWRDPLDERARHWVVLDGDALVGAIRCAWFDRFDDLPDVAVYRSLGLELAGRVALPERLVVDPSRAREGVARRLAEAVREAVIAAGTPWSLAESSPPTRALLEARPDRRVVGAAPADPRFPGVAFVIVLTAYTPEG